MNSIERSLKSFMFFGGADNGYPSHWEGTLQPFGFFLGEENDSRKLYHDCASFSPSTFPAFPCPFIFFSLLPLKPFFCSPFPLPFLLPLFYFPAPFVLPPLGKKRPLKSQVIGAFSFYIPFPFKPFFPSPFLFFLCSICSFFAFLGEEKGSHKIDLSVHFLFHLSFSFPFLFLPLVFLFLSLLESSSVQATFPFPFPVCYFLCSITPLLSLAKKKRLLGSKSSVHFLFTSALPFKRFFPSPFLCSIFLVLFIIPQTMVTLRGSYGKGKGQVLIEVLSVTRWFRLRRNAVLRFYVFLQKHRFTGCSCILHGRCKESVACGGQKREFTWHAGARNRACFEIRGRRSIVWTVPKRWQACVIQRIAFSVTGAGNLHHRLPDKICIFGTWAWGCLAFAWPVQHFVWPRLMISWHSEAWFRNVNPLRRSRVSSARNAGEVAISDLEVQPSAEIVRVDRTECR